MPTRRQRRKARQRAKRDEIVNEFLGIRKEPNEDPLIFRDRHLNLSSMRDMWRGCAGFLVGGGPSLKDLDLSVLRERGIVSLGVNNVVGKAHCSAFTCSDPAKKFHHGIWLDPTIMKIVPVPRLKDHIRMKDGDQFIPLPIKVRDCPNVWAYKRDQKLVAENFITSQAASWGRNDNGVKLLGGPKILFTFFLGLRLMHYLGCRRVYLLGVDFSMDNGKNQQYAFNQRGGVSGNNKHYRNAIPFLEKIKPVLEASGMDVYNCNAKSGLKVFEHIDFDTAVKDCRGLVPEGPFDMQGWYEKKAKDAEFKPGQTG